MPRFRFICHRAVEREVGQRIAAAVAPGQSALVEVSVAAGELLVLVRRSAR